MKRFLKNQKGFTLVELMIVIVIVGILAAVAIPIYQANVKKAKQSECDAALGTIRTALRVYYAENQGYPVVSNKPVIELGIDISGRDLQGKYFDSTDYVYTSSHKDSFKVMCQNEIFGTNYRWINQDGTLGGGF